MKVNLRCNILIQVRISSDSWNLRRFFPFIIFSTLERLWRLNCPYCTRRTVISDETQQGQIGLEPLQTIMCFLMNITCCVSTAGLEKARQNEPIFYFNPSHAASAGSQSSFVLPQTSRVASSLSSASSGWKRCVSAARGETTASDLEA